MIDLSEETLKALAMPSKRPQAILQHLERQERALQDMQAKIKDQIRRLQVEETFLKKKLHAAPLEDDNIEAPSSPSTAMDVDSATPSKLYKPKPAPKPKITKPVLPPESSDEEEEEDDEDLPPSLQNRNHSYNNAMMDEDDFEDDDDDAMDQVRRILQAHR